MRYTPVFALAIFFCHCNSISDRTSFKDILNTKIYYEEHGQGAPLVILSGGGINRSVRDFDKCVDALSKHFRVILPDSPGQGRSEQPDTLSYEILTDFFSGFIDSLSLDTVYVMGWSDGAIASLLLAEKYPGKVKKTLAVGANNGLAGALPAGINAADVVPQALEAWGERNKETVDAYTKEVKRDWKKMMNFLNAMWYQEKYFSDSVLTNIRVPVMIAQGDKDEINIDHAVHLYRLIPNSQLCILPNTTHEVFSERPEIISQLAINFFSGNRAIQVSQTSPQKQKNSTQEAAPYPSLND
ncbi:MAG: alpha/beta hydrolase [Chitinophagaceae bacterium]|nr:alpha/beta hydrolase [Chitinophagaceae bacterium]